MRFTAPADYITLRCDLQQVPPTVSRRLALPSTQPSSWIGHFACPEKTKPAVGCFRWHIFLCRFILVRHLEANMKAALAVVVLLSCTTLIFGQTKDPATSAAKEMLAKQSKNLTTAVEEMPADKFGFKPTPEQMTFGHLGLHIAEANNVLCSSVSGVPQPKTDEVKESDGKDKIVAAVKASFEFCNTALPKVNDGMLGDTVDFFGGRKVSRAYALMALTGSWADHYSEAAMYLRLSGLLPPTAQKEKKEKD